MQVRAPNYISYRPKDMLFHLKWCLYRLHINFIMYSSSRRRCQMYPDKLFFGELAVEYCLCLPIILLSHLKIRHSSSNLYNTSNILWFILSTNTDSILPFYSKHDMICNDSLNSWGTLNNLSKALQLTSDKFRSQTLVYLTLKPTDLTANLGVLFSFLSHMIIYR